LLSPGNKTVCFIPSRTSPQAFLISCCISFIVGCDNTPVAILAIFMARPMSDSSSCTRPPCLAIVADMFKTYRQIVAASKVRFGYCLNHIQLCSLL
jgi:hypothetical protein